MKPSQTSLVKLSALNLANAASLVSAVVMQAAGREVGATIGRAPVTVQAIEQLALAYFQRELNVSPKAV